MKHRPQKQREQKNKNSAREIRAYLRDADERAEIIAAATRTHRTLSGFVRHLFQEWKEREQATDTATPTRPQQ
jgi:hypothetical protein